MRYLASFIILLFFTETMTSQTYEVGLLAGGSNYVGDVGSTYYIAPNDFAFGALAKWNRSKRHAFRFSFLYAELNGDDSKGDDRRQERGFEFKNSVKEVSLGMEFNFWDWYLYDGDPQFTPYLYTGITVFNYDQMARNVDNDIIPFRDEWSMAIPMVVGVKKTIGTHWIIGAEIGARYTFTDNLDGSDPSRSISGNNVLKFGNTNNNDWYFFTGITLTYTWGRIPCYCVF
ncbi:type IX secretion system protein PorG [Aquimarina rhabdastrellae]